MDKNSCDLSSDDAECRELRSRLDTLRSAGVRDDTAYTMLRSLFSPTACRLVFPNLVPRSEMLPAATKSPLPTIVENDLELAYQYAPFIQCSFPHSCPDPLSSFQRRNGRLTLTISTKRAAIGLPYGIPARLLTIFITSAAVRAQSREVYLGATLREFLQELDIPISRGPRGSLITYADQLQRLIETAFTIEEHLHDEEGRRGLDIRQTFFAERARMWWDANDGEPLLSGSSLELSAALYESIVERAVPLKTNDIKLIRKSCMDLDVYSWLVHRLYRLPKLSRITWQQLEQQFGHSYSELRVFKFHFSQSLKRIAELYPEANWRLNDHGIMLFPSRPLIARAR
jgi:hypothetical protein